MERLQQLIGKLNEQQQQKESPLQMLLTLKHIEAELTHLHTAHATGRSNPGVSVVMPSLNVAPRVAEKPLPETPASAASGTETGSGAVPVKPVPEITFEERPAPGRPAPERAVPERPSLPTVPVYRNGSLEIAGHTSPAAEALRKYQPQPLAPGPPPRLEPAMEEPEAPPPQAWSVDPLMEVPTLSHQPGAPELNDIIGLRNPSINDRLKDNGMSEMGYALKGSPVKELRKAIGVNDRFTFINELFRGDEAMYERSIKTINNFRILPEAQYWMERELKIKIGWDDSRDIVQHFYELVSRRFS